MNRERLINDVAHALAAHDRRWPALVVAAGLREAEAEAVATAAFSRLSQIDQSWWLAPCDFDSTIAEDAASLVRFLTHRGIDASRMSTDGT